LRLSGAARIEQAEHLFRFVFHVTLPALAFVAIASAPLARDTLLLPVIGFSINLVSLCVAYIFARALNLPDRNAGALMISAGITNMIFVFPFILATLGQAALADAVIYDIGNGVFVATVANAIAARYGDNKSRLVHQAVLRLIRTPLLIALLTAILLNISGQQMPTTVANILTPLGAVTIPLTVIALGVAFRPGILRGPLPMVSVLLRMPLGFAAGLAVVWYFNIEGVTATVVIVSAAAPIGFSAVSLAAVAKLDTEQAAAALSLSVLIGLFSTSALLWITQAILASPIQ
jgi:predicted permease